MKMQIDAPESAPVADLSDQQVNNIKSLAGGEEQYGQLVGWAAENCQQKLLKVSTLSSRVVTSTQSVSLSKV